ncbi:MAG: sugar phosphate isomerase/epimerase family protein [Phycisphaeraceae bacterium]
MPIEFAFSTVACPDWTIDQVAANAKAYGYDSVELRTLGEGGTKLASDPALSDTAKVRQVFANAGVKVACLSTSLAFHDRATGADKAAFFQAGKYLDMAAEMGAPAVRFFGLKVMPGENRNVVLRRIAQRVAPIAEKAMELGVEILFENAGSFCTAKEWWWLLNMINHPMVGMLWNIANAAGADPFERGGGMAVTMLNSKIRMFKIKDTKFGEGTGFVPLGEGDCDIPLLMKKLRGIGFEGTVSVEWDRVWLPALAPAEEYLPDALERLKKWMAGIDELMAAGRKDAEKIAGKKAPKSMAEMKAG